MHIKFIFKPAVGKNHNARIINQQRYIRAALHRLFKQVKPAFYVRIQYSVLIGEVARFKHESCRIERIFKAFIQRQKYYRHRVKSGACRSFAIAGNAGIWREQIAIVPLPCTEAGNKGLFRRGVSGKNADIFNGKPRSDTQALCFELLQKRGTAAFVERNKLRIKIKHRSAHTLKCRAAAFIVVAEICEVAL